MSELRAAAERLRRGIYTEGWDGRATKLDEDRALLADWAMERIMATPADDDEPISEMWLESVGFSQNPCCSSLFDFLLQQRSGWEIFIRLDSVNEYELQIMQSPIGESESRGLVVPTSGLKTRGNVRRLCAALGITLGEPK